MRDKFGFVNDPEAMAVVDHAAAVVHAKYPGRIEAADLRQEGVIALATQEDLWPALERKDWGLLQHGLERDLEHVCQKLERRAGRDEPLPEAWG